MSDSSIDSGGYRETEEQLSRVPGSVLQRLSAFHRIPTSSFKTTECPSKNHKTFSYDKATEIKDKSYQKCSEREWLFRQQYQHQQPPLKHTPLQMRVNKRLHWPKSFLSEQLSPEHPAIIHSLSSAPRLQLTTGFLISQYHNRYITPHYLVPHWTFRNTVNDDFITANNSILSHIHSMPSSIVPFCGKNPLYPTIFIQSGTFPVYKTSDQRRLFRTPETSPSSSETNIETSTPDSSDEVNGWRKNMSDFDQRKPSRHPQMVTSLSSNQFSIHNISNTRWASNTAKIGFNSNRSREATEPPGGQGSRMVSRYNCRQCTYSTDRKNNLKRHVIAMHRRTDRVLECCGMTFENKSLLRSHVTACHVHGYACAVCRRTFRRKALYTRHMAVHNGRKHYACKRCDYATSHKSNLIRHNRVHVHPATVITEQTSHVRNTLENRQIADRTSHVKNTLEHRQINEQTSYGENTLEHRQINEQTSYGENTLEHRQISEQTSYGENTIEHRQINEQTSYGENTIEHRQINEQTSYVKNTLEHRQISEQTSYGENTLEHRQINEQTSYVKNTLEHRQINEQTSYGENTLEHRQISEQTSYMENTHEHRQMRFSRKNSFSCDLPLVDDAQDLKNRISNDKSKKSNTTAFNNHYRDTMNSLASLLQHETSSVEKNPNELVIGGDFNSDFNVRSTAMKQKQPEHLKFELDMDCVDDITSVVDMNEQMDEDCNAYFDIFKCATIDRGDSESKDDEFIDVVL